MDSPGERLFQAYLRQRQLAWEREPAIGGRRPDFLVEHPVARFVAEVYEPELHLPPKAGPIDSYRALRRSFRDRKAAQVKAFKEAGFPCVLVVASTRSHIPFQPQMLAGAMFGDLGVQMPLGDTEAPSRMVFLGGGRVQPGRNTGVTAVALLQTSNPTAWRMQQAEDDRLRRMRPWSPDLTPGVVATQRTAIVRVSEETRKHMEATGTFLPDARVARLTVLHNPYALHALGLDVLDGPHDTQWARTEEGGTLGYGPVQWGAELLRIPMPYRPAG